MKKLALLLIVFPAITGFAYSQDTLPKFSVKNVGNNRMVIGWVNNFNTIKQISIQRSFDSLRGFKSILTVADPTTPQNGYVDTKAVNDHMFYRLYIMLDKGFFMFSEAKKPVWDTLGIFTNRLDKFPGDYDPNPNKTRLNGFVPSLHVFTSRDGYVRISLPDEEKPKKYAVKFFDEDGTPLFEIKEIKEKNFKIDKANFYHAGWFHFELYEDDKLLERHKFYLEKEY